MTPYLSPNGRILHGAHIEPIIIKVGGREIKMQAHIMVWWLVAGTAKGVTGQYSMH
jgi:hypothetical protein